MSRRLFLVTALAIVAMLTIYVTFSPPQPDNRADADMSVLFGENGLCESQAVLLAESADVRPEIGSGEAITLDKGQPVFLCEEANGYRKIVFPQQGTPADCAMRETEPCVSGYLEMPVEFEYAG